jgi:hypothetical protein
MKFLKKQIEYLMNCLQPVDAKVFPQVSPDLGINIY